MIGAARFAVRRLAPLTGASLAGRGAALALRLDVLALQQATRIAVKMVSTAPPAAVAQPVTNDGTTSTALTQHARAAGSTGVLAQASGGELAELEPLLPPAVEPPIRKRPAATRVKLTPRQQQMQALPPEQRQKILKEHKRAAFWLTVVAIILIYLLYMDLRIPGYSILNLQLGWASVTDSKRDRVIQLNRKMIQLFVLTLGREEGLSHDSSLAYQILLAVELLQKNQLREAADVLATFFESAQRAKISEKYTTCMYSRLEAAGYEWLVAPWLREQETAGAPVGLRWRLSQLRKERGEAHFETLSAVVRLADALLAAELREEALCQRMGVLQALAWRYGHVQNWDMLAAALVIDRLADAEALLTGVIGSCSAALGDASNATATAIATATLSAAKAAGAQLAAATNSEQAAGPGDAAALAVQPASPGELRRLRTAAYASLIQVLLEAGQPLKAEQACRDGLAHAQTADADGESEAVRKLQQLLQRAESALGKAHVSAVIPQPTTTGASAAAASP